MMMVWRDDPDWGLRLEGKDCFIWMTARPHYCDRGNWLAHVEPLPGHREGWQRLSVDGQDLWPRYYFDLDRAKAECEAWLVKRGQAVC
jgi:hypothetical protein